MSLENKHLRLRNTSNIFPKLAFAFLLLQLLSVPIVQAMEGLTAKELASYCAPAMEVVDQSLLKYYTDKL